jgi:DNA processing protein
MRRGWLLSRLSGPLEYCARDRERLRAVLALDDDAMIEALGGRRRAELRRQYASLRDEAPQLSAGVEALCDHDPRYPRALLTAPGAPRMLNVLGGAERLSALCAAPTVSILGSRRPSDYGREMARSLARSLTASGVSVAAAWQDGVAIAAHEGALEASAAASGNVAPRGDYTEAGAAAGGNVGVRGDDPEAGGACGSGPVAVLSDGLALAKPARHRALLGRLVRVGCAVSELPYDCGGRRWGQLASERTIVGLGAVAVVVEAEQSAGDLFAAGIATSLGRTVAAVPGRVTSPLSRGTNTLLSDGARLVRDAEDVLELLYETDGSRPAATAASLQSPHAVVPLDARLRDLLERVGAGDETPDSLVRGGMSLDDALAGLSELELLGLLWRGDGGRYVLTEPLHTPQQITNEVVTKAARNVSAV